ncbi:MAG: GNAT family N-acetyltransferase [Desulfobacterales bacterium]|nr:GNAT family N-acetyltransferase [Deltaproteobacteria bacterium]NNK96637.1 GNAT family N-acetyltransferase [Desulfobacterales bacterium]
MSEIVIRQAAIDDAALILKFVKELALYEKADHEVLATEEHIRKSLFGPRSTTHAIICEKESLPVGFAVYFFNYSTWLGKHGLYLEDLFITPTERGGGVGKTLFKHLAQIAVQQGCGRFEWSVLDWNEPAIIFYESVGAKPLKEWVMYRLSGQELINFAAV